MSRVLYYAPPFEYDFSQNILYLHCKAKANNGITRQINGNIKAPSLRIIHWNKGSSKFCNKIDDIKLVIDRFQPHLFSIVEANYDLTERQTI